MILFFVPRLYRRPAKTTLRSTWPSLGEKEAAFQWLERSFADYEIEWYWLKVEPEFASLHGDPRWQEMLDRIEF